jgi:hypothetical protein
MMEEDAPSPVQPLAHAVGELLTAATATISSDRWPREDLGSALGQLQTGAHALLALTTRVDSQMLLFQVQADGAAGQTPQDMHAAAQAFADAAGHLGSAQQHLLDSFLLPHTPAEPGQLRPSHNPTYNAPRILALPSGGTLTAPPDRITLTLDMLYELARARFGDDVRRWQFLCPSCGCRTAVGDFHDHAPDGGIPGQECIGRHMDGIGCNYAAYGVIVTAPWTVLAPDGACVPHFALAEAEPGGQRPDRIAARAADGGDTVRQPQESATAVGDC